MGSGVFCTGAGACCPWPPPSSTDRTGEPDCVMNDSTSARNKKIPAVHHVTLVGNVVAWRPPMIVSVPAPPPMVASPPPCPACNSTAVARISESRIRIPTRIPYMRGARYLGDGGAHKLRPGARVERRSADQDAVQLRLCQQLGGILQVHAAAIQDHKRRGRGG